MKKGSTLNSKLGLLSKARIGLEWLLFKTGLGATNHFEATGMIRTRPGLKSPDIQYHFLPAAIRYDGKLAFDGDGFQVHLGHNDSTSRGSVEIISSNPEDRPKMLFNYYSTEEDKIAWRRCIRITREIMEMPALDEFRGEPLQPRKDCVSDEQIDEFVRDNLESAYHYCSTNRMGKIDDPMTVVDSECKVKGLHGLRVVDASIFPRIPNGNTNSPTMMTAERASDIILGKGMLPRVKNAKYWLPENWQTKQREGKPVRETGIFTEFSS